MKILIGWLIAQVLGLLFWLPLGRAAKRGDKDAVPPGDLP